MQEAFLLYTHRECVMLHCRNTRHAMHTDRAIILLLRFGVAFAFLYPAINAFFDPYSWVGYLPSFLDGVAPEMLLLHAFGVMEIIIGLWILSGRRIFIPSTLATITLAFIILLNLSDFQVLFRDVPILLMSLALMLKSRPHAADA